MIISVVIGFILACLLILVVRKILPDHEQSFWRVSLVIAALLYVVFALVGKSQDYLPIEVGGVALYSIFVWLSKKHSLLWLAFGWALHIGWDVLLHATDATLFVPRGYAPACIGFDIAIAGYIGWIWWHSLRTNR